MKKPFKMRLLLLMPLLCLTASAQMDWQTRFGTPQPMAIVGNGSLTAGFTEAGWLSSCRWPSPGLYDQLAYDASPSSTHQAHQGARWGMDWNGERIWLEPKHFAEYNGTYGEKEDIPFYAVSGRLKTGQRLTQYCFVHPTKDILIVQLRIWGEERPKAVYWYQNFAPCTRVIPEAPIADWALDGCNDFAVFFDRTDACIYHFRPNTLEQGAWKRAQALAQKPTPTASWDVFTEGIWVATGSPNKIASHQCGKADAATSAWRNANNTPSLSGRTAAAGHCNSALQLELHPCRGGSVATVFIAFGPTRAQAAETLAYAQKQHYQGLLRDCNAYWAEYWKKINAPAESPIRKALLTLALARDAKRGVVVQAPITYPPLALASARTGAWISLALDQWGLQDWAAQNTLFYAQQMQQADEKNESGPPLAAACYVSGEPALPAWLRDVDATAWALSSFWLHAQALPKDQRNAYLESVWAAVREAGDFLTGWTQGGNAPAPGFQWTCLRETRSRLGMLTTMMGVEAARRMAKELEYQEEEARWHERLLSLYVAARIEKDAPHDRVPFPTGFLWYFMQVLENNRWNQGIHALAMQAARDEKTLDTALAWATTENDPSAYHAALYLLAVRQEKVGLVQE